MGEEVSFRGRESHWGFTQVLIDFSLILIWLHQISGGKDRETTLKTNKHSASHSFPYELVPFSTIL